MDEKAKKLFFEIHSGNPREGPGSRESTERAFSAIPDLPDHPVILDIGFGPGAQTMDLVGISGGTIIALDFYPQYLHGMLREAERRHLLDRILAVRGDMNALPFEPNTFDLIWSEGAIYIMGFENGLRAWKRYLKPAGCIAVTDIAWLKENPPENVRSFFAEEVPGMTGIPERLAAIDRSGYRLLDHFILPEDAWWNYYTPIEKKLGIMTEKYKDHPELRQVIEMEKTEISMYREYSDCYGYVFYIMQKGDS